MNTSESYQIWLKAAYHLFAEQGPENFSVKEVAKLCGLPRTNFYYYFDNKNELLDKVIDLHFQTTTQTFNAELTKHLNTYIPDLYKILYEYKVGVQFTKTLFKHRETPQYNRAYIKGIALSADLIIPKFKDYFNINLPDKEVKKLWFTLADAWYSRLSFDNYSVEYLCALCFEIMDTVLPLIKLSNKQGKANYILDTPV